MPGRNSSEPQQRDVRRCKVPKSKGDGAARGSRPAHLVEGARPIPEQR